MRRERKILLAIRDSNYVKEYIKIDLQKEHKEGEELSPHHKKVLHDKTHFKQLLAQKLDLMQLTFFYDMLNKRHKATILDPNRFQSEKEKHDEVERKQKEEGTT